MGRSVSELKEPLSLNQLYITAEEDKTRVETVVNIHVLMCEWCPLTLAYESLIK